MFPEVRRFVSTAVRVSPVLRQGLFLTVVLALLAGVGRIIAPLTIQHVVDAGFAPGTVGPAVAVGAAAVLLAGVASLLLNRRLQEWLAGLPEGRDSRVGLRGERLSVGERQLVALARTAPADPDLIILDEATSGIDPATDVAVQHALAALTKGRTTITIAHRMNTAAAADRVLVFDHGRIVQARRHDALVGEPGPHAGLVSAWARSHPDPVDDGGRVPGVDELRREDHRR